MNGLVAMATRISGTVAESRGASWRSTTLRMAHRKGPLAGGGTTGLPDYRRIRQAPPGHGGVQVDQIPAEGEPEEQFFAGPDPQCRPRLTSTPLSNN